MSEDKSDLKRIVAYSDDRYIKFVANFIDGMDPATRAHVAVAYQNLIPILSAMKQISKRDNEDFTIEGWLIETIDHLDQPNEIAARRIAWFVFAGFIARLEKVARRTPPAIATGAAIWTIIIAEYPRLRILLPDNIVWKDLETEWFDLDGSDKDLLQLGINHHIPLIFAEHEIVERFAKDLGLFCWPSKPRLGYVP